MDRGIWQATVHGGHRRIGHDLAAEREPENNSITQSGPCSLLYSNHLIPKHSLGDGDGQSCLGITDMTPSLLQMEKLHSSSRIILLKSQDQGLGHPFSFYLVPTHSTHSRVFSLFKMAPLSKNRPVK